MICTHRHTNYLKINFWNNAFFLWKFFWNFLQTLNFVRPRAKIEKFYDMSNILHMPIIFSKLFFIFKITIFLWKIRTFLILSPLSARRNFCTARQICIIFKPHLWLSPHFFSDLYDCISKSFWYELLFVEISGLGLRMDVAFLSKELVKDFVQ